MTLHEILFLILLICPGCRNDEGSSDQPKEGKIPKQGTVWSASSAPFIGESGTGIESWKRLNERLKSANGGYGLTGRRTYDKGIPDSFATSAMAEDPGNCPVSIGSFKPSWSETVNGTNYEALRKFIYSLPDNRTIYLTFYHEPEDNVTENNTKEMLQKAFARFVDIVVTSGKPNVHPCFVLMTWTFKKESGRNPDDYDMGKYLKPGQHEKVIAGVDGYAKDPALQAKEIFEPSFAKMKSWGFTRFGIFETGAHASETDPAARSTWVKGLGEWVNSRNDIELVSWFNNGNGQHAGPTGWYLGTWEKSGDTYSWGDLDGTIAAYSRLLVPKK